MMHTSVPQTPNRDDESPVTLSLATVAERYDVDEKTVRRWIAQGLLTAYRVGPRLIRVDARDVEAMMRPIPTTGKSA